MGSVLPPQPSIFSDAPSMGVPGPEPCWGPGAVTQIYTAPSDHHCPPPRPRVWPEHRDGWQCVLSRWGPCSSCRDQRTCSCHRQSCPRKEKCGLYCRSCRQQLVQSICHPLANSAKYQLIYYYAFPRTKLVTYVLSHLSATGSIYLMTPKKRNCSLENSPSRQNWITQNN